MSKKELGETNLVEHCIDTCDAEPIKKKMYCNLIALCSKIEQHVQEMPDLGLFEPSIGPWVASIIIIKKKSGEDCFCTDFCGLNGVTKKYAMPLLNITEILDTVLHAKIFSTLDLISSFWQIPIHPDDHEKMAFTCPMGLFQYKHLLFGLMNAPASKQSMMS